MASGTSICVVIDGPNVACRRDKSTSMARLAAAIDYFDDMQSNGTQSVRCVAFVPNFWLHVKPADKSSGNGAMETDDWALLQQLVDKERVILTPSHAHDDFYVIDYAVKNDGFIVTNDMFRDHVENKRVFQGRKLTQQWVRSRCIDFTFVGNEFLPNSQAMARLSKHTPKPGSPHGTIAATSSSPSTETASQSAKSPSASTTRRSLPPMRSSSLQTDSSKNKAKQEEEEEEEEVESDHENDMTLDNARKKQVDLSELTPYRFPRHLLHLLHGDDGETLKRFQDHTGTYIVVPNAPAAPLVAQTMTEAVVLSIYGDEVNRSQAVKILDAALPDLQQQFLHQQEQLYYQQMHQHHQQQAFHQPTPDYNYHPAYHHANPGTSHEDHMMEIE
ncbi:hypothetical protein Poli38472_006741 [Pythium oligandrum]|uniref:RNase NYN domain-containing protein n=1 Tax=Pythium oligandrum TaxID=41045 RepID=A0A8K1FC25_PYTOL|nr:hypothetical protein Poli38472_006741 [Pythium oligandrum]|eukprot:TMW56731.1 hypothetical protein Poli38472_006741 [Pythium oligandrum]